MGKLRIAVAAAVVAVCGSGVYPSDNGVAPVAMAADAVASQTTGESRVTPAEYPDLDGALRGLLERGETAKRVQRRLNTEPNSSELPRDLLARGRLEDALDALRRIVRSPRADIPAAFSNLAVSFLLGDASKRYHEPLRQLVADARARLSGLPEEATAAGAMALTRIEHRLEGGGSAGWPARLQNIIDTYPGTEAALLAEVDLIDSGRIGVGTLDALEAFANAHPRTSAAAAAWTRIGNHLTRNNLARGPERNGDPTTRFLRVKAIVDELTDGHYPASEWVDRAPDILVGFFISDRMTFDSDENVRTLIAEYVNLARTHFALSDNAVASNGIGYVVTSKIFDLYDRIGDPVAGVEGVLDELERTAGDAAAVKYLRAHFYIRQFFARDQDPTETAAYVDRALDALGSLAAEGIEPYSRRALATRASVYVFERRYAEAVDACREYLAVYPDGEWAWGARLRIGQALTELGRLEEASTAYRALSSADGLPPVAAVLANAFEAEVLAALGRPADAAERASAALDGWDDDYGLEYRTAAQQRPLPGDEPLAVSTDGIVTKTTLARRLEELREAAAHPGGADLERGRWLLERRRVAEALDRLRSATEAGRGTPLESAARGLVHATQLEAALQRADLANPDRDEMAALALLDELAAEPADTAVLIGRVARATLLALRDGRAAGDPVMRRAFDDWLEFQAPAPVPPDPGTIDADVLAIRNVIFMPGGGGVYGTTRWNAFDWPVSLPQYMVVNPDIVVKREGAAPMTVTLRQSLPRHPNVVFADRTDLEALTSVMRALGGTERGQPASVMATPNQPRGRSQEIRAFWNAYFPMRQGHWSGWELETYPTITDITFVDEARTKAEARVIIGYSGGTVLLVKERGVWRATEMTNFWIT